MRIAIVVHGRFEAFDLARELLRRGNAVTVFTNYPSWAAARFGVPGEHVRSFVRHGVLTRALGRLAGPTLLPRFEPHLHRLFGRWAANALREQPWDVAYAFSGVAEEMLASTALQPQLRIVVRASSHIRYQDRLLREEERRTGARLDRPSAWMIAREEREYAAADSVRVLSSFARETFIDEGVPESKVKLVVSGVETRAFQASEQDLEERCKRVLSGAPLRVLTVGTFAYRKGVWDTAAGIRTLGTQRFAYRFVGPVVPEAADLAAELQHHATFVPKLLQSQLPQAYAWGDVFLLPSIEDGFPAVLAQAAAAGLPIVTTPNGAGHDLVEDGKNGWVVAIRRPDLIVERLRWADAHRLELADMIRTCQSSTNVRDSAQVAADFERMCADSLYAGAVPAA
ncbi:MAG: glycosyltransferase family 4 protein [Chloroflexi bacterium]|nr:glycosyltransferase family 4 protein [Chloroflexota bacterium]